MPKLTLGYEGITIGASLQCSADLQWLQEFLRPWFDLTDAPADVELLVTHEPSYYEQLFAFGPSGRGINAFMMDTRVVVFPVWAVPGEALVFHDERHKMFFLKTGSEIRIVCKESGISRRMHIMRVLRELAMGAAQLRGGQFLHAAAVAVGGRALIITGPRQAGKTSLLTYLLANSPAQFLSNDRLLARPGGKSVELRGMPTILSIRDGTLDLFPGMRKRIEDQGFSTRVTLAEAHASRALPLAKNKEGRLSLSPAQYSSLLDCDPIQAATGAALLFPRQSGRAGGLKLTRLAADETRRRLKNCMFGHIGPDRLSEAFTAIPRGLARVPAPEDASLHARLARDVPAFDCLMGTDTYSSPEGAAKLLELLHRPVPGALRSKADPLG